MARMPRLLIEENFSRARRVSSRTLETLMRHACSHAAQLRYRACEDVILRVVTMQSLRLFYAASCRAAAAFICRCLILCVDDVCRRRLIVCRDMFVMPNSSCNYERYMLFFFFLCHAPQRGAMFVACQRTQKMEEERRMPADTRTIGCQR